MFHSSSDVKIIIDISSSVCKHATAADVIFTSECTLAIIYTKLEYLLTRTMHVFYYIIMLNDTIIMS